LKLRNPIYSETAGTWDVRTKSWKNNSQVLMAK
jgi:hypothetical protein